MLVTVLIVLAIIRVRSRPAAPGQPATHPPDASRGASLLLPAGAAQAARGARTLHGDARRTHRAAGRGPRAAKVLWTYAAGGPVAAQVTTSPDEQMLYVATLGAQLAAVGRDGTRRWSVTLGDRIYSTPCIAPDGTIYVGSDSKHFFALGADGTVRWKLETNADADTGAFIAPSGTIVFAAGRNLFGVRPGGSIAFRFAVDAKIFTSPALTGDGLAVFGAQDHRVSAVRLDGTLAWSVDLGADVDGGPAIGDDGSIFVGTDGDEVVRLDGRGAIVWRRRVGGFVRGPLSVARNGDVLAGVYGPSPHQARLAASDGSVRVRFPIAGTGARQFGVHGGALEDDTGTLFFGGQDDTVYAIGLTGELLWRFSTRDDVDAPLTLLSDGSLVVGSDDGHVYLIAP